MTRAGSRGDAPAPPADESELARAAALVAQGERQAARALLTPLEAAGGALGRQALAALAALDEAEGRLGEAMRRWQLALGEDIDDDEAWAHLTRLRERQGDDPVPATPAAAPPTLESAAGVELSRFEILGQLGRGTFATVYRARDRMLGLELALKVLHPRGTRDRGAAADQAFFQEARRVAALRHPGVVAIYDIDPIKRTLAMELVPGGTLRDRLRTVARAGERTLPLDELLALARGIVGAILHVHAADLVHGDLSLRNVLLRKPGDPVLIDFGGSLLGPIEDQPAGTPLYLAPEQFAGAGPSAAADLFAAGAVLWEVATLAPMRTRQDLMAGRTAARPVPADVDARIAAVITALTAADPAARAAGAQQTLTALG